MVELESDEFDNYVYRDHSYHVFLGTTKLVHELFHTLTTHTLELGTRVLQQLADADAVSTQALDAPQTQTAKKLRKIVAT